jgi:hypothetical protein
MDYVLNAIHVRAARTSDIRTFLGILGLHSIIRTAPAGYAIYIASAGTARHIATPLVIETALALAIAAPVGWFYGDKALLIGLIFSTLTGSLFSSTIVASLNQSNTISSKTAFASLLMAQTVFSGVWWFIVRSAL